MAQLCCWVLGAKAHEGCAHVHPYEFISEGRAGCALKLKLLSAGSDKLPISQFPVVSLSCTRNLGRAGVVPVPKARPCGRPLRLCCRACLERPHRAGCFELGGNSVRACRTRAPD